MSRQQPSRWHYTCHEQNHIVPTTPLSYPELVTEQRFQTLVNTAPVMLWLAGCDGAYTFFNHGWLEFTGRSLEQELGLGWLEGMHPEDRDVWRQTYEARLKSRVKFQIEYRLRSVRGDYRWILDSGVPHLTAQGSFAGYVGSCIDITEHKLTKLAIEESRKAAQAQVEQMTKLNRLKEEFLSTVSHELRTPLTNMKMAIQMLGIALDKEQNFLAELAKPQEERSKAARYFQILSNECDREISLINNFLDLQRVDSSTKPLVLETIQLQKWLVQVVELFQARNRNKYQQELRLSVDSDLPVLISDPFSLERIVIELLTNACKFSPAHAIVTITAQKKSHNIQLQVTNTGVEIPVEELTQIFEKFYRIPSNDPWKQGGTGLGLALVQKLIQYLGGTIEVKSASDETCFIIELPVSN